MSPARTDHVLPRVDLGAKVGNPDDEVFEIGWFTADNLPQPIMAGDLPSIHRAFSGNADPLID